MSHPLAKTSPLRRLTVALCAVVIGLGPVAVAPALAASGGPAVHAEAHDHDHADGDHHHGYGNPKARTGASEDLHWWLGQELLPKSLRESVADMIGPSWIDRDPPAKLNVGHIFLGIFVFVIGIGMALAARRKIKNLVLPPKKWGATAFFDILIEALLNLMVTMMPREKALRFLPLITSFAVFIMISNCLGLVPGLLPATQSMNTTLALGLVAFVYYQYHGIRTHGVVGWLKHFMGPLPFLAPLMFPIELISHLVRPISLAVRLMGNMFGDHQVLFIFMSFGIPFVPLPLIALGLLVCLVQTLVFTLLAIVYLALAVEEHEHHDDHDHAHDHGHGAGVPAAAH